MIPLDSNRVSPVRRWAGLVLLVVVMLIYLGLSMGRLRVYEVYADSMEPTLQAGDRVLVVTRRANERFSRGDVVAMTNPFNSTELLIKRVIALPGDTVEIRNRIIYVNGVGQLHETYVKAHYLDVRDQPPQALQKNEYYVLGDNRSVSLDSTEFGAVPVDYVLGRAIMIYWPFRHARSLRPGNDPVWMSDEDLAALAPSQ